MKKSSIIEEIKSRLGLLEKEAKEDLDKKSSKTTRKPSKPPVDEDVCPSCGGDLLFVEDGIVFCNKCNEYFELENEGVEQ